ncbi:rab escort protein 1-like [Pyrus communis]|uniref:rab escort protein 1-like n=1 Tax=Pyrus communis TaxID=23211 RepID=UPI0035C05EF8
MTTFSSDDPIEPATFDLIIIGTGLPGSVIAAAASAAGKTVLQLDPYNSYGSHFASLHLNDFTSFIHSHATPSSTASSNITPTSIDHDYTVLDLKPQLLYSNIEIANYAPEILAKHHPERFTIDLGGPRVFFCADKAIDLILKSGVYHKVKSIDANFIFDGKGQLWNVPDSRGAIFKDKSLSLIEKNKLMKFFKLVWQHLAASDGGDEGSQNSESSKILEEDLESPFVDFLKRMQLPHKIKSIILYAIAMVDYDQGNLEFCKSILKTREGIERLALYQKSRLTNAPEAMIYPKYGHGDLSYAICRRAAVKGCVYAERVPVSVLMDKHSEQYKGVRLSTGQDLFSHHLVLDPTFKFPLPPASSPPDLSTSLKDNKGKVARGICITTSSMKPDISNCFLVYPPGSLYPEQRTSIRAIQIAGSSAEVCPKGMFVLYFSALCDDAEQGKRSLHAAMNALLTLPVSGNRRGSTVHSEDAEIKPTLVWSTLYIQELIMDQHEYFISTPMPDGNLNYNDLIDATAEIFHRIYPDEEFFPLTSSAHSLEDDCGVVLEN